MRLVLSGSWVGNKRLYKDNVLYEAKVKDVNYLRIEDLDDLKGIYFLVFSYDLASRTLGLNIKKSDFPELIAMKLCGFEEIKSLPYKDVNLTFTRTSLSPEDFMNRVQTIKELIKDGTVYQINFTNRFDFILDGKPYDLFYRFFQRQPVPYGFFLDLDDFYILSGSMELFLEREGERLWSKPIKGTSGSEKLLGESQKDKAENLMIVDVMRNDLGRVARVGSVRVSEIFKVTQYSTLFQMHSTIECETSSDFSDIIKATFPPASVTGAPKRKAVEIIDMLEPHSRGYYCGSAGLFFGSSDFTLSVLIRVAIGKREEISYYAGCGIVWDSEPRNELEELYLKVKAFYDFGKR